MRRQQIRERPLLVTVGDERRQYESLYVSPGELPTRDGDPPENRYNDP